MLQAKCKHLPAHCTHTHIATHPAQSRTANTNKLHQHAVWFCPAVLQLPAELACTHACASAHAAPQFMPRGNSALVTGQRNPVQTIHFGTSAKFLQAALRLYAMPQLQCCCFSSPYLRTHTYPYKQDLHLIKQSSHKPLHINHTDHLGTFFHHKPFCRQTGAYLALETRRGASATHV